MRIRAFVATGLLAAGGCFGNGGVLTPAEFVRLTGASPAAETQGAPLPSWRALGQPLTSTGTGGGTNQAPANLKPRLLSAGMVISVAVEEDRSLSRQFVVPNSGTIDYPPLGRLEVAGLTTDEFAQRIKTQLERDYFNTATVRVAVESATTGGGVIYVLGSVNRPGPLLLPADESFTVTKVIIAAGNLSTFGNGGKVQLIRYGENGKKYVTQINVSRIMARGEFEKDIPVRNGDWIIVPEKFVNF